MLCVLKIHSLPKDFRLYARSVAAKSSIRLSGSNAPSRSAASTCISCAAPPAPALQQWLSGHSSPSTDSARSYGRSPLASRGRFKQFFFRHRLLHFVEDAAIGRHDKLSVRQRFCRLNKLTGGAHRIGHLDNGLRRFRVNQKSGIGIDFLNGSTPGF